MTSFLQNLRSPSDIGAHDFRLLIDGDLQPAESRKTFQTTDPATGQIVGMAPDAEEADVQRTVRAARAAQQSWGRKPYEERRLAVLRLADVLRRFSKQFGLLDTMENGNVLSAMELDAAYAAHRMEYLASVGYEVRGSVTNLDSNLHYTRRHPFGVVVRLLPFNHPIASAGVAIAAPLLMGNSVILKPSPHTSLSALVLGEAAAEILPPGVLNILSGQGHALARSLVTTEGVSRVSLTGSIAAGQAVMKLAADRLLPLTLELGGKNPLIVFADADIDHAVGIAIAGMNLRWQGHSCGSTSRILLHRDLKEPFLAKLSERLSGIRICSPLDSAAEMGAISFAELHQRCLDYIESGIAEGARLVCGGRRPSTIGHDRGFFLSPALFADVSPDARIAREEIFGPVISVIDWDDYDRMIEIANGLDVGLTAAIVTNEITLALKTADALETGYVEINGPVSHSLGSPFGGIKMSGFGREGGIEELLSYTRGKSVNVRLAG